MLGRDEKCCQDLLILKISPRVLVLLVIWLFLRPESFRKPARKDFARAVTQGWFYGDWNSTHDPLSKIEVHSTIYDSKISNLWTAKPCFGIIHGLLVSVSDKVSKPRLSRITAQYSLCNL